MSWSGYKWTIVSRNIENAPTSRSTYSGRTLCRSIKRRPWKRSSRSWSKNRSRRRKLYWMLRRLWQVTDPLILWEVLEACHHKAYKAWSRIKTCSCLCSLRKTNWTDGSTHCLSLTTWLTRSWDEAHTEDTNKVFGVKIRICRQPSVAVGPFASTKTVSELIRKRMRSRRCRMER